MNVWYIMTMPLRHWGLQPQSEVCHADRIHFMQGSEHWRMLPGDKIEFSLMKKRKGIRDPLSRYNGLTFLVLKS